MAVSDVPLDDVPGVSFSIGYRQEEFFKLEKGFSQGSWVIEIPIDEEVLMGGCVHYRVKDERDAGAVVQLNEKDRPFLAHAREGFRTWTKFDEKPRPGGKGHRLRAFGGHYEVVKGNRLYSNYGPTIIGYRYDYGVALRLKFMDMCAIDIIMRFRSSVATDRWRMDVKPDPAGYNYERTSTLRRI